MLNVNFTNYDILIKYVINLKLYYRCGFVTKFVDFIFIISFLMKFIFKLKKTNYK